MIPYPYFAPIILTDQIFENYGGQTGTFTHNQLEVAYWLAETQMTEHLNAFLKPTLVTGSYPVYGYPGEAVRLDTYYVLQVLGIEYQHAGCGCTIQAAEGCSFILDGRLGYILVSQLGGCGGGCGDCGGLSFPAVIQVPYISGLSSGTAYQPNMLLALTMAATQNLNEMFYPMALEGGAGDPGISEWSSMQHREVRVKTGLGMNAFGNSPIANKIAQLVRSIAPRPAIKLGG